MATIRLEGPAPLLTAADVPMPRSGDNLDLTRVAWATPFDVAVLAALTTRMKTRGRTLTVKPPADESVRRYLVDLGVADHIPGRWGTDRGSAREAPLLRLTRVREPHEWDDLVNDIWPSVIARVRDGRLASQLFEILGELVDNAATHGASEVGTFVCVQRYTGLTSGLRPGLWIGIADAGVGIPRHLRRNPAYAQLDADEKLIGLARRPWVTGTPDRRGWGLVEVFDHLGRAGVSQVVMRSGRGEARYWFRRGRMRVARYRALARPVPGTWVHVEIHVGSQV